MFIYLDSQTCGNEYGLCVGDPSKELETLVPGVIIICSIIYFFAIGVCAYCCHLYHRKRARARRIRSIRAITTQSQPQHIYRINLNPSTAAEPVTQQTFPSTHKQIARETIIQ
jgi:hypothetical protein